MGFLFRGFLKVARSFRERHDILMNRHEAPRQRVEDRFSRPPGCFRVLESKAEILDALRAILAIPEEEGYKR